MEDCYGKEGHKRISHLRCLGSFPTRPTLCRPVQAALHQSLDESNVLFCNESSLRARIHIRWKGEGQGRWSCSGDGV